MRRDAWIAGGVWVALALLGELVLWNAPFLPPANGPSAEVADQAFRILVRMAVPVFAFVVAVLLVAVLRFRSRGEPTEDGPPIRGRLPAYLGWLGVTGLLAHTLIVFPGLTHLGELRALAREPGQDLVVQVSGARWAWTVTYPEAGVQSFQELVLPVGRRVRFEVTSVDVVHSFWIPAFRVKIDAVPGRTTVTYASPEEVGDFATDSGLRLQCAELCGLGHATMRLPVRVVDPAEFDAWLQDQAAAAAEPAACRPSGTELRIVVEAIAFDTNCLAAPADTPFTVEVENRDAGVPHNLVIAADEDFTEVLFAGETFNGVETRTYRVPALPAGTYHFRCSIHPIPAMSGTLVVGGGGD